MKGKIALLLLMTSLLRSETLVYEKTRSGQSIKTTWQIEKKGSDHVMVGSNEEDVTTVIYDSNFEAKELKTDELIKKSSYEMKLDGNVLHGVKQTAEWIVQKQYRLSAPWIQNFTFGFKPFIQSNKRSQEFTVINPKNLKVHRLIIKDKRSVSLNLGEKTYSAIKAEITLPGFEGMFWSADIWLDPKTGEMLQYRGDEGPSTPTTTIRLLSKS